ncbi:hypothetical protein [Xylocopilactobacillus apicola]|uniref:Immunity protein n=1 Tax=Xylocopilactobacillus apicola TaxID=2932184 RepID=A0AAU9D1V7_9LACO|nr:hypothetical protein [Xylocopilactobacillus apicola]BDR58716.1 hypothetical protein XA3_11570 [Xylocopilactobacillus apicola]
MWETILGILVICLGAYEIKSTIKYFHGIKDDGNESTSPFALITIYFSLFFGGVLLVSGMGLALHLMLN